MFNTSKIVKKGDSKVTELEEELAKTLQHYEQSNPDIQAHLKLIYINSAEQVEYKQADGTVSKYILVRIPFRSLNSWKKVSGKVIDHLEGKFRYPVVVVANRTIISTRGKFLKFITLPFSCLPPLPKAPPLPHPQGSPQRHP